MQNKILIAVLVVVVLGVVIWAATQDGSQSGGVEEGEEVFSMTAVVASVDAENNALMVKPTNQEGEIRVVVSETTQLIKLEFPFDPANPPAEATFTPTQTEIEVSEFEEGDNIFIKAKENIAGKTEISEIDFIHILP